MNKFSIYEQVGIITPGALFLFIAMFHVPELREVLGKDGISIGGLGVFLLVAFAAGHLLAALGNVIESVYWRTRGGIPTSWVVGRNPKLLAPAQIAKLGATVQKRLGFDIEPLSNVSAPAWFPIVRQIYSEIERHDHAKRVDTFNGTYGLNRGLCAATLALAVGSIIMQPARWPVSLGLVVLSAIYLSRMHRFGLAYARELYNQFLLPVSQPAKRERPPE